MQTQEIERAKRRFQVVLEGLRILMNATSSEFCDLAGRCEYYFSLGYRRNGDSLRLLRVNHQRSAAPSLRRIPANDAGLGIDPGGNRPIF